MGITRMNLSLGFNAGESIQDTQKRSKIVEELGMKQIWISDLPIQRYPFIVAAAVAKVTNKIRIGLGVISPFIHNPIFISRAMTALEENYGHRFELCLGLGDRNMLSSIGISIPKHEIAVQLIKNAMNDIQNNLLIRNIKMNIWLAAQGEKTIASAGDYYGVILNYGNLKYIKWAINKIDQSKTRIGIAAPAYIYDKPEQDLLTNLKKASLTIIQGTSSKLAKTLGFWEEIKDVVKKPRIDQKSMISPELAKLFAITMPSTELPNYLEEAKKLGVDEVMFGYPQGSTIEGIRTVCKFIK